MGCEQCHGYDRNVSMSISVQLSWGCRICQHRDEMPNHQSLGQRTRSLSSLGLLHLHLLLTSVAYSGFHTQQSPCSGCCCHCHHQRKLRRILTRDSQMRISIKPLICGLRTKRNVNFDSVTSATGTPQESRIWREHFLFEEISTKTSVVGMWEMSRIWDRCFMEHLNLTKTLANGM
jgi:hypothetical protein